MGTLTTETGTETTTARRGISTPRRTLTPTLRLTLLLYYAVEDISRMLKKSVQQGRRRSPVHLGVDGMIPTARVQRGPSEAARCASKGIAPSTPLHFSASVTF
ncbi:MAG: hypothetical protein Q8L74_14135 [Nitrospirota bacterium]|nr:hypothetical protein [Nitrospirota bacterium]MDP2383087.1 hypothetical protein [Nitrospirota bacterium]MDP3596537.1 hypothetical protein [Nitrospirota bacterium]